ncbi:uncharacterized protein LOC123210314 isoform X2 [Mangifera indica]|uniref:uncharacterized protein LOC123210314 isoform X2 n=1 Tax=Mangifera indica TaxID=29780 RepID=UPI001CF9E17E|nr:uncharacterized protein LOC123210314 isoform X2 [Mangifera indica]
MDLGDLFKPKNGETHLQSLAKKSCAIPMLNQVMSATRGATGAFSGVSRQVNDALRKVGAKNIQAGIGCGVGFGHGFGIGLAVKPSVINKFQSCLVQAVTNLVMKFGMSPNLSVGQGVLPMSLQTGMGLTNETSNQNPIGNIMQLSSKIPEHTSQVLPGYGNMDTGSTFEKIAYKSTPVDASFGRTEKVLSSFLQNPVLKEERSDINEVAERLRSENNLLQMVLKHQQVIEELMQENEKLREILVEDLKIPPSKLLASYSSGNKPTCTDCFKCRRKQRKR